MATTNNEIKYIGNVVYKRAILAGTIARSIHLAKYLGLKDRPIEFKMKI